VLCIELRRHSIGHTLLTDIHYGGAITMIFALEPYIHLKLKKGYNVSWLKVGRFPEIWARYIGASKSLRVFLKFHYFSIDLTVSGYMDQ